MRPRPLGLLCLLVILVGITGLLPPSWAGGLEESKIALHVKAHAIKGVCTVEAPSIPCSQYETRGDLGTPFDVYLFVASQDSAGLLGMSCGIRYDNDPGAGVDVFGWTLCTDGLEFPNSGANGPWPASGGGNRITSISCMNTWIPPDGVHALFGSFYVYAYSEDQFQITANENIGSGPELIIGSCPNGEESVLSLSNVAMARFSSLASLPGVNPCLNGGPPGACSVTPTTIDFGTVAVGSFADRDFTITNTESSGGSLLSGVVPEDCGEFQVISGAGQFVLSPQQALTVTVRFSPTDLDPSQCQLYLGTACAGVDLLGNGASDIEVRGEEIVATSVQDYTTSGATTVHQLPASSFPLGSGTLDVTVTGDYGNNSETASIFAEGTLLGSIGGTGQDCLSDSRTFVLDETFLSELVADGVVEVSVVNTISVGIFCSINRHQVELAYRGPADPLDFGGILVGSTRTLGIEVHNVGTAILNVAGISVDEPAYSVDGSGFQLSPGEFRLVEIIFTPSVSGFSPGTLSILSDDPNEGLTTVSLLGEGFDPPVATFDPEEIIANLFTNETEIQTFYIGNEGQGDLEFRIDTEGSTPPPPTAGPKIALHTKSHISKGALTCVPETEGGGSPTEVPCSEFTTQGNLTTAYDVYLVIGQAEDDGIGGLSCGIEYTASPGSGVSVFDWRLCADGLEFRNAGPNGEWPASGGGNRITWVTCQNNENPPDGVHAVAGSFYIYAYDSDDFQVTENRNLFSGPELQISNCQGAPTDIPTSGAGFVRFAPGGNSPGFNPCLSSTPVVAYEPVILEKGELDSRVGEPVVQGTGGPDLFGYRWVDSDQPGGPVFSWTDIRNVGWPVPVSGDDSNSGPLSIGFAFPYYGGFFDQIYVCTNGWISFTSTSSSLSNQPLPSPGAPENLLAVFWDDLVFSGTQAYYWTEGSRLTVQFQDVMLLGGGGGPYTFQVILEANGTILYQYLSMSGSVTGATTGIQNGLRNDGLTVAFNTPYVHDNLAIRISTGAPWLTVSPIQGVVSPGESQAVNLGLDATGLFGGVYQELLSIFTNDPLRDEVLYPVTLNVTGVPDIAVSDTLLVFDARFIGTTESQTVNVSNLGTDQLIVSGIGTDHPDFSATPSSLVLAPGASQAVTVGFAPSTAGLLTGHLILESNDPDEPVRNVSLTGEGLIPPEVAVSPTSMSENLLSGETSVQTLAIKNSGGYPLDFQIRVDPQGNELSSPVLHLVSAEVRMEPMAEGAGPNGPTYHEGAATVRDPHIPASPPDPSAVEAGLSLLILHSGSPFEIQSLLLEFPTIGTVDLWDGRVSVPTLDDLNDYDTVILAMGNSFPDPVGMGNVLADYADAGGGIVMTIASFVSGFNIQGRLLTGGYFPFEIGSGPSGSSVLGPFDPAHPIMQGVSTAFGDVLASTTPGPGAELVASWQNGLPLVATKGSVVGVNAYVANPGYWTGDIPLILHNAALWTAGGGLWVSAEPRLGTIPPGGTLTVTVAFDAGSLLGGEYAADLVIETNDPDEPAVFVPIDLSVTGVPKLVIAGEEINLQSTQEYAVSGARTEHEFILPELPGGSGLFELVANGDYGDPSETATLTAEGTLVGIVGPTGIDCAPASGSFPIDAVFLAELAGDGVVEAAIQNTFAVDAFCSVNEHTLSLVYSARSDTVLFDPVFLGHTSSASITFSNIGSDDLSIQLTTDDPDFVVDLSNLFMLPGESHTTTIQFTPAQEGLTIANLVLVTNDPDQGNVSVRMVGEGRLPPDITVSPNSLTETLPVGDTSERDLVIGNEGLGPLDFGISVRFGLASSPSEPVGGFGAAPSPLFSSSSSAPEERTSGTDRPMPSPEAGTRGLLETILASTPPQSIVFYDDMESGPGDWTTVVYGLDDLWHQTQSSSNSPVTSWWCGIEGQNNYATGNRINTALISPPIDLNQALTPINLQFFEFYDTEPGWDYCMVDVSSNGGATWAPLRGGPGSAPAGSSGGWIMTLIDLSSYAGQTIQIRFYFDTLDGAVNDYPGWFVDDVLLTAAGALWLSADPAQGAVGPAQSQTVNVLFDATEILGGDYSAELLINSNDPMTPQLAVPAELQAFGIAQIELSEDQLDFGSIMVGRTKTLDLQILNVGSGDLIVDHLTTDNSAFQVVDEAFTLSPAESRTVAVTFGSDQAGLFSGSLRIQSNDPQNGDLLVPLTGESQPPPSASLSPDEILSNLFTNETESQTATLSNAGGGDLLFSVDVTGVAPPPPPGAGPKIALHTKNRAIKSAWTCLPAELGGAAPTDIPCTMFDTQGSTFESYDVYIVVGQSDVGVSGVSCGIEYNPVSTQGIDVFGWTFCGGLEFPNSGAYGEWPASGGGNRMTWQSCQDQPVPGYEEEGIHVVVGAFYVFAYDTDAFEITPNNNLLSGPELAIADCVAREFDVPQSSVGKARFSAGQTQTGFNPCLGTAPAVVVHEGLMLDEGAEDPRVGDPVTEGAGGPDLYGYRWIDSDEPGGPIFDWVDIQSVGTPVPISGDNGNSGNLPIGFSFPFYENWFDAFRVCTNGWISFTSTGTHSVNQPLPSPAAPENLLAVFWDDLFHIGSQTYYHYDGSRLIVQYQDVLIQATGAPITFQVILYPSGTILYQYLSLQGPVNSATVGIQNQTRDDGLTIAFNTPYPKNNLAIRVARVPEWVAVEPASGVVPPGQTLDLEVLLDAGGLFPATLEALVSVRNNDPQNPVLELPVTLSVSGAPSLGLSATAIDFGTTFLGTTAESTLIVTNLGTETLNVTQVTVSNPEFVVDTTPFNLAPTRSRILPVAFTPTTQDPVTGTLSLESNDPVNAAVTVALAGRGAPAPEIAVSPASLSTELLTGGRTVQTLNVTNSGASTLEIEVKIDQPEGASAIGPGLTVDITPGAEPGGVRAAGRPVPLGSLSSSGFASLPTSLEIGDDDLGDRASSGPDPSSTAQAEETITGLEFFGNPSNGFVGSFRTRGNLFFCSSSAKLVEHRLYLNPSSATELWFVVYEGLQQVGAYSLVSASSLSSAGPGEGWYSSGTVDQYMVEGRYYLIGASFMASTTYYNEQGISPYPIPASFGELQAGVGWSWAPPTVFPPPSSVDVPPIAFGEAVAYYQALLTGSGVQWVSVSPQHEYVNSGSEVALSVIFDATGLEAGGYDADIVINSNAPNQPQSVIPAHLDVTAAPDLALFPPGLGFGSIFLGMAKVDSLVVSNPGTEDLAVTQVLIDHPDFALDTSPFTLPPSTARTLVVTYAPSAAGAAVATLSLESNDPDTPTTTAVLSGAGVVAPEINTTPDSLHADISSTEQTTGVLSIANSGGSNLKFSISPGPALASVSPPLMETPAVMGLDQPLPAEQDPESPGSIGEGNIPAQDPLHFYDGFEDGDFDGWIISGSGPKEVTGQTAAAGTQFSYHEWNSPSGHLNGIYQTFTDAHPIYVGFYLRSGSTASHDGYFGLFSQGGLEGIFFFAQGNGFFYVNADVGGNESVPYAPNTWYQIEFRDIDWEGKTFDYYVDGVFIQADLPFRNGQAVTEFARLDLYNFSGGSEAWWDEILVSTIGPMTWLSVDPTTGIAPPGGTSDVTVHFDGNDLLEGSYRASLLVQSEDPVQPLLVVPVTMNVKGVPDLVVSTNFLDFGPVVAGAAKTDSVHVTNEGNAPLNVNALNTDNVNFLVDPTPFVVLPSETKTVFVTYSPSSTGAHDGEISIESDDPDTPKARVVVRGEGLVPPEIFVGPTEFTETLVVGEMVQHTLTVSNEGGSNLDFTVAVQDRESAAVTLDLTPGSQTGAVLAVGRRVPVETLRAAGRFSFVPTSLEFPDEEMIDRGPDPSRPSGSGLQTAGDGFEVFGNTDNMFLAGFMTRGNLFFCTTSTQLLEHRFFLNPSLSTELWFVVYEGDQQVGIYDLVRASNVTPAGPGEGWYSSGSLELPMEAGKYYLIAASFQATSVFYNQQGISPYPIPASFGELQAGVGWSWAPLASFPPTPALDVPSFLFGEPVAYHQALLTGQGVSWLPVNPAEGVIPPGLGLDLTVTFDATDLESGLYQADIVVNSNDPDEPQITIPADLSVIEAPRLVVLPEELYLGNVFLGSTSQTRFLVVNEGVQPLSVSSIAPGLPDYSVSPSSFELAPQDTMEVTALFSPVEPGDRRTDFVITSNDPDSPHMILVTGDGVSPPELSVSPPNLVATAPPGGGATRSLTVCNEDNQELEFAVSTSPPVFGGPDSFGHIWFDSDTPGGAVFDWVDVSGVGTEIFPAAADDENVGPFPIGFSFPHYGEAYGEFRVCSNGWVSFTNLQTNFHNLPLPNDRSTVPENLLAVFWDDLIYDPALGSSAFYHNDGSRMVIQFNDMCRFENGSMEVYTFEILLYPNGDVVYQYLSLGAVTTSATIGIQNQTRDDGLQVAYNEPYLHESLAVKFTRTSDWLSVSPAGGSIPVGECTEVQVLLDATALPPGDYFGTLVVTSVPPAPPGFIIDVVFHVGLVNAVAEVLPPTVDAGSQGRWVHALVELPVGYDAADIVLETARLNETVPADPGHDEIGDFNQNGIPDRRLRFERGALLETLPLSDVAQIQVTGEVRETVSFQAGNDVQIVRPRILSPGPQAQLMVRLQTEIAWEVPPDWQVDHAEIHYSPDAGQTWTLLSDNVTSNPYLWVVPEELTEEGLLKIHLYDEYGFMAGDESEESFHIVETVVGVAEDPIPSAYALLQNMPNPFATVTTIRYDLPEESSVTLRIFDVSGKRVTELINQVMPAGRHHIGWDGRNESGRVVSSGVYFYRLEAKGFTETKRMFLVR